MKGNQAKQEITKLHPHLGCRFFKVHHYAYSLDLCYTFSPGFTNWIKKQDTTNKKTCPDNKLLSFIIWAEILLSASHLLVKMSVNGGVAGSDFCLYLLMESNFMVVCCCSLLVLAMFRSMFHSHLCQYFFWAVYITCGCMTRDKH